MNKFLRIGLMVIGLGVLISSASVSKANGQVLRDILQRMDTNNKLLKSMTAGVTMVKTNVQLGISETNIGTTSYVSKNATPSHLMWARIDWTKPEEHVAVVGDNYELWQPRLNQVIRGKSQGASSNATAGNALSFISMSREQLKANYDVTYLGEEKLKDGTGTWHLQLMPKGKSSYKTAELWVDPDGMPRQAKVTEANNDTTTILLSAIVKNPNLKAAMFALPYDKKKVKFLNA